MPLDYYQSQSLLTVNLGTSDIISVDCVCLLKFPTISSKHLILSSFPDYFLRLKSRYWSKSAFTDRFVLPQWPSRYHFECIEVKQLQALLVLELLEKNKMYLYRLIAAGGIRCIVEFEGAITHHPWFGTDRPHQKQRR